jgi:ribonuclease-3
LNYSFNQPELLLLALTHKSYANETSGEDNERLEFLGDAVLGLVSSEYLYKRLPEAPEGELAKIRAAVVCEATLAAIARRLGLNEAVFLGRGELKSGGANRQSTLCDALEAVLGAIYLDGGLGPARQFVLANIVPEIDRAVAGETVIDAKTVLQELVQERQRLTPLYRLVASDGPDHNKVFTVEVYWGEKTWGRGRGRSKKAAEQAAAREALENFRVC